MSSRSAASAVSAVVLVAATAFGGAAGPALGDDDFGKRIRIDAPAGRFP